MVETEFPLAVLVEYALHAGQVFQQRLDLPDARRVGDIDMGQLMIGEREGLALRHVEMLTRLLDPHLQKSGFAQSAVDVDRPADRNDAVFGEQQNATSVSLRSRDEIADHRIDLLQIFRHGVEIGSVALQPVIEMGQVDETERRVAALHHMDRGVRDPAARLDGGRRPPEREEREGAELLRQLVAKLRRGRITVGNLAPVGLIDRPRRDHEVGVRRHGEPPEHVGAGEALVPLLCRLPDLLAGHQSVRLAPQPNLHQIAK